MGEGAKKHYCFYCSKPMSKIARHLEAKHADESDVAKALSFKVGSKERKLAWENLRKRGDYEHNYECRKTNSGSMVPKYRSRSREEKPNEAYTHCVKCNGLYLEKTLSYHMRRCKGENGADFEPGYRRGIVAGRIMDPTPLDRDFRDQVLVTLNNDRVKQTILEDSLVLEFGNRLFESHKEQRYVPYVANKMRELGRLTLDGKERHGWKSLEDGLAPSQFEQLIDSVKSVAGFMSDSTAFSSPSTAIKLGYSLSTCNLILRVRALRQCDESLKLRTRDFSELYKVEWRQRIVIHAQKTLDERRYNTPKRLPFVEDTVKLNQYLKTQASKNKTRLVETNGNAEAYGQLIETCLSQIILFNRRRSGEAQWVKQSEVEDALKNAHCGGDDPDMEKSLSAFEKRLFKTHVRIETKGKKGRKVPILLTADMKDTLEHLLKYRKAAGVNSEFLFTKPGKKIKPGSKSKSENKRPVRGCDCLRASSMSAGLKSPELMTSTKLRQQLGTHCQILGLSENSQDILATFMGHDIRVHRQFYRLPENIIQIAKVSKVLHAINSGNLHDMKGRDFDSISFDIEEQLEDEDPSEEQQEEEQHSELREGLKAALHEQNKEIPVAVTAKKRAKKRKKTTESDSESDSERLFLPAKRSKRERVPHQRKKWENNEIQAVNRHLAKYIRDQKLPGKAACEEAIRAEKSLETRTWTQVKFFIKNQITLKIRCMTSSKAV
jgi:hypothetical protein